VGEDVRYSKILALIEDLDFNVFELKSVSGGNELVLVINHLMEINQFYDKLNIVKEKFRKYSVVIQKLYNPVSYHNKTHATDVTQTSYYFLTFCDLYNIAQMSDMEAAVLVISSMVHDTDHPGVNNLYLVATRDRLALRYNDKSVLENHHIAVAFNTMLKSKDTCIYENFSNEQFKQYREYMIDLVLATDNANHNKFITELTKRESSVDFDPKGADKKLILELVIHLADISNPTKPWRLCYKWIDLLFLEFFKQGDKEREK
jgi:cAMP-specific phosphodiesterase 4